MPKYYKVYTVGFCYVIMKRHGIHHMHRVLNI